MQKPMSGPEMRAPILILSSPKGVLKRDILSQATCTLTGFKNSTVVCIVSYLLLGCVVGSDLR